MKIVLATAGTLGDILPVLALVVGFQEHGHEVCVCAPPKNQKLFDKYSITYYEMGIRFEDAMSERSEQIKKGALARVKAYKEIVAEDMKDEASVMLRVAKDADMIITGGSLFVGKLVAEYLNIPYKLMIPCMMALETNAMPASIVRGHLNMPRFVNWLTWKVAKAGFNGMMGKQVNENRESLGLKKVKNVYDFLFNDAIVATNPIITQIPDDVHATVMQTSFLELKDKEEIPDDLLNFIEQSPKPPIYIGFGSQSNLSSDKIKKVIIHAVNEWNYRFIVSEAWADIREHVKSENVFVCHYVPFGKLFPKLGLVIHHGGAGTFHLAAKAGVPQIVFPHDAFDQFYHQKRAWELHIGPKPIDKITEEKLAEAIKYCMEDPTVKKSVKEVAEALRKGNGVEEIIQYTEQYIEGRKRGQI